MSFLMKAGHRLDETDDSNMGENVEGPENRMAGKDYLLQRGKKSQANIGAGSRDRQNKDRLGEIHLPGDLLHFPIGEASGFGNDRHGIAAKNRAREDIGLIELDGPPTGHPSLPTRRYSMRWPVNCQRKRCSRLTALRRVRRMSP